MTCLISPNDNYCERHQRIHAGEELALSQRIDVVGETYRRLWSLELQEISSHCKAVMNSNGLGDTLLFLSVSKGVMQKHKVEMTVGLPEHLLKWAELFPDAYSNLAAGYTLCKDPHLLFPYDSYPVELHTASREFTRAEWYAKFLGPFAAPAKLATLHLAQEDIDWAEEYEGSVVICPYAHWHSRNWLGPNFLHLEDALRRAGKKVVVLDSSGRRVAMFRSPKIINEIPGRVAALIKAAEVVVGVDSGMMHLAGLARTRGVCLCGPTQGNRIFNLYPTVEIMQAKLRCSGCYWRGPHFMNECRGVCAAINHITVQEVLDKITPVQPKYLQMRQCQSKCQQPQPY